MLFYPGESGQVRDLAPHVAKRLVDLWEGKLGFSDAAYTACRDFGNHFASALPPWRVAELRSRPSANLDGLTHIIRAMVSGDSHAYELAGRIPFPSVAPASIHAIPSERDAADWGRGSLVGHEQGGHSVIRILFLGSNPHDQNWLHIDREIRGIESVLRQAVQRDRFSFRQEHAVQSADLEACLLRHSPNIVHFSGHGSPQGELLLEGPHGLGRGMEASLLQRLFLLFASDLRCVVLNACYTESQARTIAESIDFVIGMSKSIGNLAAIAFSTGFYQALAHGRSVQTAFDLGCLQITLIGSSQEDAPRLHSLRRPASETFI